MAEAQGNRQFVSNTEELPPHGRLKIFFGYAAGVGKTYAMLEAAHQAQKEGIDVVVGYVERHARPDTLALLDGLEILPCKTIDYRGIQLQELDLDKALQRKPQLILVDELAHNNAQGCRHTKRYQDVEELLQAGINVYTTVNVQHMKTILLIGLGRFGRHVAMQLNELNHLDLGLPDIDGIEVIHKVRSWSNMPIIVISARSEDTDKIDALDAGADDYLTKPFSVEELLARLRVTQRRLTALQIGAMHTDAVFTNGKLKVDYAAGCAFLDGQELHLTPSEYKLLCLLCKNVGKVLTHTFIAQQIWGRSWENDVASLRVFMATLRKKLEKEPGSPQYIQTHIGVGYRMMKVNEGWPQRLGYSAGVRSIAGFLPRFPFAAVGSTGKRLERASPTPRQKGAPGTVGEGISGGRCIIRVSVLSLKNHTFGLQKCGFFCWQGKGAKGAGCKSGCNGAFGRYGSAAFAAV